MPTKTLKILFGIFLSYVVFAVQAQDFDHQHSVWNKLLQQYVDEKEHQSSVKYAQIKASPSLFNQYLADLSQVSQAQFDAWSKAQQMAFLINAYNAFTVKLIIDHYPVESIKDIGSFFTSAWKKTFFHLLGKENHLDYIEHTLIRGADDFSESRIHFALVCASKGCPKLQAKAFTAENLDSMLEQGAAQFLSDISRNRYNQRDNILQISRIFKWYAEDFIKLHGSIEKFIAPYMSDDVKLRGAISSQKLDIEYLDYDWQLNDF